MSLVNLNRTFVDLKNETLKQENVPFTLKEAILTSLVNEFQNDTESSDEKVKRFKLMMKVNAATDSVELSSEDITLIKNRVAKAYGALIVGQAHELLENN